MTVARVIPVLLLKDEGLVKTTRFRTPTYIGDPRNAVRIFNEREVDELVLLDISASRLQRPPRFDLIREIISEAFIPIAYGGGVRTLADAKKILSIGVEKIVVNTAAIENPTLISEMSSAFGSQSVVVSIDVKKKRFVGGYRVFGCGGTKPTGLDPTTFAAKMIESGAGELIVSSIDRDGLMCGYDHDLVKLVTATARVPVIALGGASRNEDFATVVRQAGASAAAAGSMFVFHGPHRAVLINYPDRDVLNRLFAA